jgi:uncharacterized protein YndB with AHSA1/START domain
MNAPDVIVRKSIRVRAPITHAFHVFTEKFDVWWPHTHHIGKVESFTAILEAREGGRWFERGADGSECEWGRVLVYAPPTRLALSWNLNPSYAYDPDPSKASRVDVTFHDEGGGTTRIDLVHSQFERHGEGWEKVSDSVGGRGGWPLILDRFAEAVTAGSEGGR